MIASDSKSTSVFYEPLKLYKLDRVMKASQIQNCSKNGLNLYINFAILENYISETVSALIVGNS